MNIHTLKFFYKLLCFIFQISIFAFIGNHYSRANEVKKPENFIVSIVTGRDKDGRTIPPYIIVTEQRFIGEMETPYACLSAETSRVLSACSLLCQTSSISIGDHKVTIVRNMYQFNPPAKQYILRPESFENLKNSFPFLGLIIDTDGKEVHGNIGPPPEVPTS